MQWISDPAELGSRLSSAAPHSVGLDTEFIRERTWWPQLALVQIALPNADAPGSPDILLVDPLVDGMAAALRPLLGDPRVLKIMHSASEDLVAFKHACDAVPAPLFDTQIAAALAGVAAGVGYQRLVQDTLGIALTKGETRSDWMRRPLSPAQLDYAADDVRHLFLLHDALDQRLESLDRRGWLDEDCARLVANAQNHTLDPWPHLALRATQSLAIDAQLRLLRLLRWRDAYARDNDRPRTWILDNELAVALARTPPADVTRLQSVLDSHPKAPRKLASELWQALRQPLADEHLAPPFRADEPDKDALRRLQQAVAQRSAELGLPDGILASRRWLQPLLEGPGWPGPLAGWRRQQLEPVLAPLLQAERHAHGLTGGAVGPSV